MNFYGKIFIISGPSGSGKTTLYQKLLADRDLKGRIAKTISVTTRPMRAGEKNGRDYFFVSLKMFSYKRKAGHFLEFQKVFDNYYGTPQKQVYDFLSGGKNVLLCIDVGGARIVCQKFPEAVRIFIKTSSLEALKKRLECRGSEDKGEMRQRLKMARQELKESKYYRYVVVNDDLSKAYQELKQIMIKELLFQL